RVRRLTQNSTSNRHLITLFFSTQPRPQRSTLFPYTTLFRSETSSQHSRDESSTWCHSYSLRRDDPSVGQTEREKADNRDHIGDRSEEHTSELQSRGHLVCRLLLEKKKNNRNCETPEAPINYN